MRGFFFFLWMAYTQGNFSLGAFVANLEALYGLCCTPSLSVYVDGFYDFDMRISNSQYCPPIVST